MLHPSMAMKAPETITWRSATRLQGNVSATKGAKTHAGRSKVVLLDCADVAKPLDGAGGFSKVEKVSKNKLGKWQENKVVCRLLMA